jgi:hypothetical protein
LTILLLRVVVVVVWVALTELQVLAVVVLAV